MGSFIGGALSGYAGTAAKRKDAGKGGLISKIKNRGSRTDDQTVNPPLNPGTVDVSEGTAHPKYYKRGGKVKRGGWAKVHKNERVLTAKQSRKMRRGRRGQSAKR